MPSPIRLLCRPRIVVLSTLCLALAGSAMAAGNVTVEQKKGRLVLRGDGAANDVRIGLDALLQPVVESGADITTLNGLAGPVVLPGPLEALQVDLGDGSDNLVLYGFVLPGKLEVDAGAGDDDISVTGVQIGQKVMVQLGEGENTLHLEQVTLLTALDVRGGQGRDTLEALTSSLSDVNLRVRGLSNDLMLDEVGLRNLRVDGQYHVDVRLSEVEAEDVYVRSQCVSGKLNRVSASRVEVRDLCHIHLFLVVADSLDLKSPLGGGSARIEHSSVKGDVRAELKGSTSGFYAYRTKVDGGLSIVVRGDYGLDHYEETSAELEEVEVQGDVRLLAQGDHVEVTSDGSTFHGRLQIRTGGEDSRVWLHDSNLHGSVQIEGGRGPNWIAVSEGAMGDLAVRTGRDEDTIWLAGEFQGSVRLDCGDGQDILSDGSALFAQEPQIRRCP